MVKLWREWLARYKRDFEIKVGECPSGGSHKFDNVFEQYYIMCTKCGEIREW